MYPCPVPAGSPTAAAPGSPGACSSPTAAARCSPGAQRALLQRPVRPRDGARRLLPPPPLRPRDLHTQCGLVGVPVYVIPDARAPRPMALREPRHWLPAGMSIRTNLHAGALPPWERKRAGRAGARRSRGAIRHSRGTRWRRPAPPRAWRCGAPRYPGPVTAGASASSAPKGQPSAETRVCLCP